MDHSAVGNADANRAWPLHVGFAKRDYEVLSRQHRLDPAVEKLVLEVDDWVGVSDRGLQQPLGIIRRRRRDKLEAGRVEEPALWTFRMERPAGHAAAERRADH